MTPPDLCSNQRRSSHPGGRRIEFGAKEPIMKQRPSLSLVSVVPVALAVLLLAQGCAKKESEDAGQAAAPQEAASPAAPVAESAPAEAVAPTVAAPAETAAPPTTPTQTPAPTAASGAAAGEMPYKTFCVTCHGVGGHGDGPAAAGLNPKPASFADNAFKYDPNGNGTKGDIEDIKAIVHDGAAKHGGSPLMTPWPMLSPDQLQAVAEYVKAFSGS
jgi:mono/diheme cytochrome c family protein